MPTVSIVIATRNRPQKLERLLNYIHQQTFSDYECIIVDDASCSSTRDYYSSIWEKLDERFILRHREHPGGPSQSRNAGILAAKGKYIAFCDDDDYWTRTDHLQVAVRTLEAEEADLFFANMQTSIDEVVANPDWFSVLTGLTDVPIAGESDVYLIQKNTLAVFLRHRIHHANTLVVDRDLLLKIHSYWEKISFAEDHDLSFRLSDAASRVLFRKAVTADLDVTEHPSIARTYSEQDRLMFSMLATLHAEATMGDLVLRKVARGNRAWRLIELARYCEKNGRRSVAFEFYWQSLLLSPSLTALRMVLSSFWRR